MLKIISISIITIFLSSILKQKSNEFSAVVSVCGSILIFIFCFNYLKEILFYYINLGSDVGIGSDIIKIATKILGIGYLTEFTSSLATDLGNSIIASKVVFGGKILICFITIPVVKKLVSLLFSFL